jgi:putative endonuclease
VYILECSDGSYYTGVTNNLERRFSEHENGRDPKAYTFKRRPLKLAYQKEFQYILEAIAFEKQVKGWTRAKKEALIKSETESLSSLSKCLNSTSHENYGKGCE